MPGDQTEQEAGKERIKEGAFREWYFPADEVLGGAEKFLQYAGYELQPKSYLGLVQPDFQARRQTEKTTYEVVGMVSPDLEEAVDMLIKLTAAKAAHGDVADYVLVLPPLNEHTLIDFFTTERARWYFEIKRADFMVWLVNPDEETVFCALGGPRDKRFDDYFVTSKLGISFDQVLSWRFSRQELEEIMDEE